MAFEDLENRNFYQVLGIDRNDPSGAVHEAFIELVRKYRPEADPEGFKTVHLAYRTLMDPRARQEYDNLISCGTDIENLLNTAFAAMIHGRYKRAEQVISKIVEETGGASEALMLLGTAQYEQGLFRDSIHTITSLVERFPRVPLYRINLGNMIMNRYKDASDDETRVHILRRAREQYEKAIDLDDSSYLPYIEMAKTYVCVKDYETAWKLTEQIVGKRELKNFANFEPLLFGFVVLSYQDDFDRIRQQVLRLEDSIPDDEGFREFASNEIIGSTFGLVHDRKLKASRELVLLAGRLTPKNSSIAGMLGDIDVAVDADHHWKDFMEDNSIIAPVKAMAGDLFEHFMLRATGDRLESAAREFFSKLDSWLIKDVRSSLLRMKNIYPSIWKLNHVFWQDILNLANGKAPFHSTPGQGNISTGRLVWYIIVIIIMLARLIHYFSQ